MENGLRKGTPMGRVESFPCVETGLAPLMGPFKPLGTATVHHCITGNPGDSENQALGYLN